MGYPWECFLLFNTTVFGLICEEGKNKEQKLRIVVDRGGHRESGCYTTHKK